MTIEALRTRIVEAAELEKSARVQHHTRSAELRALRDQLAREMSPFKPGDVVEGLSGALFKKGVVTLVEAPQFPSIKFEYSLRIRGIKKSGDLAEARISDHVIRQSLPTLVKVGEMALPE